MNMLESRPSLGALVLINKDVTKSFVALKVHNARTISPKDCLKLTFAQQGHISNMIRAFNDDFVRPDAATGFMIFTRSFKFTAIRHEGGIFVRHHADAPVA